MTDEETTDSLNEGEPASLSIQPPARDVDTPAPTPDDLDRVLDIPLTLHVELGGRRMKVKDLLSLGAGTVLELDTPAGSPLQIFANETMIAQGEAVVVGERYGVRVTDIIAPSERVRRLGRTGGM
ncbi:MAG: flagellar motor switch protein FliN [Myxococcales bacterium]|nr:flagellar motor switch protein FliN [Myxococcales bacterium]